MCKFLDCDFLTAERACRARTAFRSEKPQAVNGKVPVFEYGEEFLTYGAGGTHNCYIH